MLLRHSLGMEAEATAVETACRIVLARGLLTADVVEKGSQACSTSDVGAAVLAEVQHQLKLAGLAGPSTTSE